MHECYKPKNARRLARLRELEKLHRQGKLRNVAEIVMLKEKLKIGHD